MIDIIENITKVGGSTLDRISLSRKKVKIRLILKDRIEGQVFIMTNVFYFPNTQSKLINLGLFNNARIYYHNKDQILNDLKTQKTLTFSE